MMNKEAFREYCIKKRAVTESFPFDESTLVFKVGGKIFALTSLDKLEFSVNLKCDPEWSLALRDEHTCITAGYHMSKKHWNTVLIDGSIRPELFKELIDHSYDLVVKSLTRKIRLEAGL